MSVHYKNYPWQFCPFEQLWRLPGLLTLFDNTYVLNNLVAFLRFNAIITSFINFRLNDWLKFFPKKFFFVPLKVEATLICIHRVKHTCRSLAQIIPSSNYKYIVKWYPAHLNRVWQKKNLCTFLGQVNLPLGQVTFSTHLPHGQGSRQATSWLNILMTILKQTLNFRYMGKILFHA